MKFYQVRDNLFVNLDRVLYAEVEALRSGAKYAVRWTIQGNRTFMDSREFTRRIFAEAYLAKLMANPSK